MNCQRIGHKTTPDVNSRRPSRLSLQSFRRTERAPLGALRASAIASRWRLERTHEADVADDRLFRLAPTDSSAAGNCITFALVFARCPRPEVVFRALDDVLAAYPLVAGRPTSKRYEVQVSSSQPLLAQYGVDDALSVDEVLAGGLGFRSAPLQFPAAPREQIPYMSLPDVNGMDKGESQLLQCAGPTPE